jgi:hypothetical protein
VPQAEVQQGPGCPELADLRPAARRHRHDSHRPDSAFGLDFSPGTGQPASWAAAEPTAISWLEHAAAYAAMKWPLGAVT